MFFQSSNGKVLNIPHAMRHMIKWDEKSKSQIQFRTKQFLHKYWKQHVVFEEFPIPHTRMSLDFLNMSMNVAVEVQGAQHLGYNKFFHGNTRYKYLQQLKRDQFKFDFCKEYGIILVEIYKEEELTVDFFRKSGAIL